MMLYLTGAQYSLKSTPDNPQADPAKSLGGYISSSPVPNNALNALFDLISSSTLAQRPHETIAVGLINKMDIVAKDLSVKIAVNRGAICKWKIACVRADQNLAVESIPNRYAEPLQGTFVDVTMVRAAVDFTVTVPPRGGDSFAIMPLGVCAQLTSHENGNDGAWAALKRACNQTENYVATRLSENRFRVAYRDDTVVPEEEGVACSLMTDGGMTVAFDGPFRNDAVAEAFITEELAPEEGIVLWIQRYVSDEWEPPTDEQLVEDFKHHVLAASTEEAGIIVAYTEGEKPENYKKDYKKPDYS